MQQVHHTHAVCEDNISANKKHFQMKRKSQVMLKTISVTFLPTDFWED